MTKSARVVAALAGLVLSVTYAGCAHSTGGKPVAVKAPATATLPPLPTPLTRIPLPTASTPAPGGPPVGTATMKVMGAPDTPVTITYRINGEPEQTETNVRLPWERQYAVYDEVETSVSADAGDEELTCTIILDGKLASFKTEPRPTCSFAYYG